MDLESLFYSMYIYTHTTCTVVILISVILNSLNAKPNQTLFFIKSWMNQINPNQMWVKSCKLFFIKLWVNKFSDQCIVRNKKLAELNVGTMLNKDEINHTFMAK